MAVGICKSCGKGESSTASAHRKRVESAEPNRISVLRNHRLVPLIAAANGKTRPGYHGFHSQRPDSQAHGGHGQGGQPWRGILLERHRMGAVEIPEHEHREFCLHLQISGEAEVDWWSDGRSGTEQTRAGSLILLAPGTRDRAQWRGMSDRLILSLKMDLLQEAAAGDAARVEFENRWALRDEGLRHILMEMGREAGAGWPLGGLYADLLGATLIGLLVRRHTAAALPMPAMKGGLSLARLRRAMEFLTENLQRDVRLDEAAGELGLSSFHFARLFRNSVGQSPYQYLLEQRIDRAKCLLRDRRLSVQEVAALTGWNSAVNFVRAFRQRVGQTPGAWRGQDAR